MTRKDRWLAAALSLFNFVLCAVRYWYPPDRYFDEVYYPRSAAEYLQWQPQYEWTHPPLTKLLIAFSMVLWGGVNSPLGDTGYGWRFMNVIMGSLIVALVYAFAKRITRSTVFATIGAALLVLDGFHFTQSRIATPEITVAFFSLLILYAFYRYWKQIDEAAPVPSPAPAVLAGTAVLSGACGFALSFAFIGRLAHQSSAAVLLMGVFFSLVFYTGARLMVRPRPLPSVWLWILAAASGLGAASKWNDLFALIVVCGFAAAIAAFSRPRMRMPADLVLSAVLAVTIAVYLASYIPFFLTPHPATYEARNDLTGMMDLQYQMFTYHDVTVTRNAPHPYSSKWWEWPLLIQPVAYWYKDFRAPNVIHAVNSCCVAEIIALPNPVTWWLQLLTVPFMGYLAWVRRSRALALLFVAYFAQWLPWIASPRMLFEYHFFPNDAIVILADTVALQWVYDRARESGFEQELLARWTVGAILGGAVVMFAFFYPVLAGDHITWAQWNARMWMRHWIIGPG